MGDEKMAEALVKVTRENGEFQFEITPGWAEELVMPRVLDELSQIPVVAVEMLSCATFKFGTGEE